jgi:nucleoid-associated protein YgaU
VKKILLASMIGLAAVGCQNKPKSSSFSTLPTASATSPSNSVISPAAPTYTAPAPVAVQQPVIYDTPAVTTASTPKAAEAKTATAASSKGQYKVQKGDTLFAIAKKNYGDGKQWKKIQAANPGLTASSLKVGQTITVP